jgi:PilZ domain-containing protein
MARDPQIDPWKRYHGEDYRRSSRVKCSVSILVHGQNDQGEKFVEKTHSTDLNLHGCGFLSRHTCLPGSYVTLRFASGRQGGRDQVVRAQVKRSDVEPNAPRLSRVGVELAIAGNIWSYSPAPLDWRHILGPTPVPEATGTPVLITRERPVASAQLPTVADNEPIEIQLDLSPVVAPSTSTEPLPNFSEQQQSNAAIIDAIAKERSPALARAVELQAGAAMRQLRETASQRQSQAADAIPQDLDKLLNERLANIRAHWDVQLDGYLLRMEEGVQRMEHHASLAEQRLAAAQDLVDKTLLNFSHQLEEQVGYAVKRAAQLITQKAALSVDQQLVRLTEDAHFVAREINFMVAADSAAARTEMEKALQSVLQDLRTQSEAQAKFLAADTKQKVSSVLASLGADHLALCETQKKSMSTELVQAGTKVATEFRHDLKAFFYSCLVAAAGAVEEHSKTTLDGLSSDPEKPPLPKS